MLRPARLVLALVLLSALAACTSPPAPTACPTATAAPTRPPAPTTATAIAPLTPSPPPGCSWDTEYEGSRYRVYMPSGAIGGHASFWVTGACPRAWRGAWAESLTSVSVELCSWDRPPDPIDSTSPFRFTEPITISLSYAGLDLRDVDPAGLSIYHRGDNGASWQPLATAVDLSAGLATAVTRDVGCFRLLAPLGPLGCPENPGEPDDEPPFELITRYPRVNGPQRRRLFDAPEDEDWFLEWAVEGVTYTVETRDLSPGVGTLLTVLDEHDDPVAVEDKVVAGPSRLQWEAAYSGTYYIRVTPVPGSATGCDAFYSLAFTAPRTRLTLLYDGLVEYRTSTGWVTLPEEGGLLDPGIYHFHFDGVFAGYCVGSGEQRERVGIVKLVDSAGGPKAWGRVEYRGEEGQWLQPIHFLEGQSTWACPLPEEQTVLEARMFLIMEGAVGEKTQDISADPVIVFQTGRVSSASGACTHYWNGSEWCPFGGGVLLPGTYTFRFDDGTPDTEYTVVAGEETVIH